MRYELDIFSNRPSFISRNPDRVACTFAGTLTLGSATATTLLNCPLIQFVATIFYTPPFFHRGILPSGTRCLGAPFIYGAPFYDLRDLPDLPSRNIARIE